MNDSERDAAENTDARSIATPYVSLIEAFLAGNIGAGAFAWQYEQAWLAQQGIVADPLYSALNDLFVVATAWSPAETASGDPDHSGPGDLIAAARVARERIARLLP